MNPIDTYPLTPSLAHEWDDEADSKIKASILSFLTHTTDSAHKVAHEISLTVEPGDNLEGFRNEVEDICIYTSKHLPANHESQDRLVEIVEAFRELPQSAGQPQWRYIFQDGCSMLIEAEDAQDLCCLHTDTPENKVKRRYLRNLHAFMARLTRDGVSDCSYQALQAIIRALERADPPVTTRTMDLLIVYDWVRLAAKQLMEAELDNTRIGGELWDVEEKPGFSKERWEFWLERLGDIEEDGGYEIEAREIAGKARRILEQLMEG
ncbi:hypothetical protein KCV07_g2770, partial [Aureobasidium melanogenum]